MSGTTAAEHPHEFAPLKPAIASAAELETSADLLEFRELARQYFEALEKTGNFDSGNPDEVAANLALEGISSRISAVQARIYGRSAPTEHDIFELAEVMRFWAVDPNERLEDMYELTNGDGYKKAAAHLLVAVLKVAERRAPA